MYRVARFVKALQIYTCYQMPKKLTAPNFEIILYCIQSPFRSTKKHSKIHCKLLINTQKHFLQLQLHL